MGNPLLSVLNSSVSLGRVGHLRVRAHCTLLLFVVLTGVLWGSMYDVTAGLASMGVLLILLLLHESGHAIAAWALGGSTREIVMWPLGGLVFAEPPRRPGAIFLTAAAGPAVNLLVCVTAAAILWYGSGIRAPLHPLHLWPPSDLLSAGYAYYVWWAFAISYALLLLNLLPIYPLDGGQMLQALLWPLYGQYRSACMAAAFGMAGAGAVGVTGLALWNVFLISVAACTFLYCRHRFVLLKEIGREEYLESQGELAAVEPDPMVRRRRRLSRRAIRRAQRLAELEEIERQRIDQILAKVSAHGLHSLTWWERRALRKATERERARDLEFSP